MALYQYQVQNKVPWVNGPQQYYFWLNRYFFLVDNPTEFDYTNDRVLYINNGFHNHDVIVDWLRITNMDTAAVLYNGSATWPPNPVLIGEYPALENTVFMGCYAEGKFVGFKRYRSPVRKEDMVAGRLTASALTYYQAKGEQLLTDDVRLCTWQGVQIDQVRVSPLVHCWQLRHGTKRAARRALH